MPPLPRYFLVDVLGTLVRDPYPSDVAAFFGTTPAALEREQDARSWVDFECGRIDEPAFFARFFTDRRAFDAAGLKAAVLAGFRLLPGSGAWLAELAAQGVALHALSNYPVWYREVEQRTALSRYLPWSFVSCETGVRKPDRRAFEHALATLGAEPAEVAFVDDQEHNVRSARALGMDALHFTGTAALRVELTRRGWLRPAPPAAGS